MDYRPDPDGLLTMGGLFSLMFKREVPEMKPEAVDVAVDGAEMGPEDIDAEGADESTTESLRVKIVHIAIEAKSNQPPPVTYTQMEVCLAKLDKTNDDMRHLHTQLARMVQDVCRLDRQMSEMRAAMRGPPPGQLMSRPRPLAAAPASGQRYYPSGGVWRLDESSSEDHTWADDGRPVCRYCGFVGHKERRCYHKKRRPQAEIVGLRVPLEAAKEAPCSE
jgi:hypothetical protein